jgi:hypothetical protein
MLKKWEERPEIVQLVSVDDEIQDEEKFWEEFDGSIGNKKFSIGTELESHKLTELTQLFNDFPDVFSDKLGRTYLIEHAIKVKNPKPCVSTP